MAVPRVLRIFKVREQGNLEFWVSNAVIVLSTVLGVYLAAQAGYKTALDFETVRTERESYFMRRALLDELKDNLAQADEISKNMAENGWRFKNSDPEIFKLQSYVWETMKEQSTTFQIPSEVLTGVRRYYDKSGNYAKALAIGQGTAIEAASNWLKDTAALREKVLPVIEKDIAGLREKLVGRGIEVN
ncbi:MULTISPECIES: hypothetical protein [Rhodomicrobium]|uniref:hypothetical protein n=1 Tax=Rhodomicrobium TaxID=1068 RepID=UPI000B4A8147|nr:MULTISPECIES: hypothetical protein [Rhodomicrobium]